MGREKSRVDRRRIEDVTWPPKRIKAQMEAGSSLFIKETGGAPGLKQAPKVDWVEEEVFRTKEVMNNDDQKGRGTPRCLVGGRYGRGPPKNRWVQEICLCGCRLLDQVGQSKATHPVRPGVVVPVPQGNLHAVRGTSGASHGQQDPVHSLSCGRSSAHSKAGIPHGKPKKLEFPWEGPYIIQRIVGLITYELETLEGRQVPRSWNACQLRKYYL
ncbi:hypothetical protein LIER_37022 [Lithospermum erythrorhizon]|uniref:Uncharacterized protein n=1 Tax=Lithospermum erythrorhizon TaxID=34254 RepID=A0AAV3PE10_LITER